VARLHRYAKHCGQALGRGGCIRNWPQRIYLTSGINFFLKKILTGRLVGDKKSGMKNKYPIVRLDKTGLLAVELLVVLLAPVGGTGR